MIKKGRGNGRGLFNSTIIKHGA